ncbi:MULTISPECIES: malonic semialdehyde reductase [unclassified Caulobacter]|uniref:malonic semialdehyde reductase n=1 Tax=unclassified Caulobacter TaxID=2648921 RepID=UPI000D3AD861|nr:MULTISPECIES: malonic semialdehyde reductase [unclassified Caulobacter]PTS91693.1 malonic semialdehyde reductase [Caulobacter sp. HMWF009]PTT06734.1 malonic semialdehyde reductase [Caulobacter sp. HMWF025]
MAKLDAAALAQLFTEARTRNGWKSDPIPEPVLRELYDLVKFGPTAANSTPARFVFVTSPEAKARLAALSSGSNGPKILAAPVTVIIGYDLDFPETLDKLFPHAPGAKNWFGDPVAKEWGAFRNSSLQGGYFILAARALGLDVGAMSGFDNAGVDAAFFEGTHIKSNFIASIGYGTDENLFPRSPRLDFEEAASIV